MFWKARDVNRGNELFDCRDMIVNCGLQVSMAPSANLAICLLSCRLGSSKLQAILPVQIQLFSGFAHDFCQKTFHVANYPLHGNENKALNADHFGLFTYVFPHTASYCFERFPLSQHNKHVQFFYLENWWDRLLNSFQTKWRFDDGE